MCGRSALYADPVAVAHALRLPPLLDAWAPRYNVAPGTWITAVCRPEPRFDSLWWSYLPHCAGQSG